MRVVVEVDVELGLTRVVWIGTAQDVGTVAGGAVLLTLFVLWELRAAAPMLPMRFFRNRTFAAANAASLLMFFGMFGSIFLLSQFFQIVQGMIL